VHVSWDDADAYCRWVGGRLPTEAEWEKAARGSDQRTYPWGNQPVNGSLANFADKNLLPLDWADNSTDDGYTFTAPVGSYPAGASPYGAIDMAGNVWEWVADWYDSGYYSKSPQQNPSGPASGEYRVLRGGSWLDAVNNVRSSYRSWINPAVTGDLTGFRCVSPTIEPILTENLSPTRTNTFTPTLSPTLDFADGESMLREKDGMQMVFVPAGKFRMGSETAYDDEKPVHEVYLDAFWIDKYEVSNAHYAQCVAEGTCSRPLSVESHSRDSYYGNPTYDDYPVIKVIWTQADDYCRWVGGRLPTEAEWEKAARGTHARKYTWGDTAPSCSLANFGGLFGCVGDTSAVGSYPAGASPYGAMDMAGNVWEWVADWFGEDYYSKSPLQNPSGPVSGEYRVLRGGSWFNTELGVRSARRSWNDPNSTNFVIGFRCVSPP
jgi:formylglycine-generating enzyme required for sulfatase activity